MLTGASAGQTLTSAQAAQLFAPLAGERALLAAVSGGPDSTALLVLLAEWCAAEGAGRPRLLAATVDHGWRPQSRVEADGVARLCGGLGVEHGILPVRHPPPATGLEEAARASRYALLLARCRATEAALVTAHTQDDQAETVLLRLAAGSGPAGLAGMRPDRMAEGVRHFRPFLAVAKTRLLTALAERGIGYAVDAGNDDPRFARGRLRNASAVLAREGLTAERLATLARRFARMDAAIERAVGEAGREFLSEPGEDGRVSIAGTMLAAAPEEVALRLLARAVATQASGPVKLAALERLFAATCAAIVSRTPAARSLAGAKVSVSARGEVTVSRAAPRRAPSVGRNPAVT